MKCYVQCKMREPYLQKPYIMTVKMAHREKWLEGELSLKMSVTARMNRYIKNFYIFQPKKIATRREYTETTDVQIFSSHLRQIPNRENVCNKQSFSLVGWTRSDVGHFTIAETIQQKKEKNQWHIDRISIVKASYALVVKDTEMLWIISQPQLSRLKNQADKKYYLTRTVAGKTE